jgi:hypothetical protein
LDYIGNAVADISRSAAWRAANYSNDCPRFICHLDSFYYKLLRREFHEGGFGRDRRRIGHRRFSAGPTGGILVVVYAERGDRIRIISAREATDYERRNYYRAAQEE